MSFTAQALALRAARDAGQMLLCRHGTQKHEEEKGDANVGHHAIVTAEDVTSQKLILEMLSTKLPQARFITEEKDEHQAILLDIELRNLFTIGLVFGVDPLDGSSTYGRGLYEWSVSIGVMENGRHTSGAIYAPSFDILISTDQGEVSNCSGCSGSVLDEPIQIPQLKNNRSRKSSMILVGPDIFFLTQFHGLLPVVGREVRTMNANGSCALALALIVLGKVDGLIQPVQCPWDWFAAYPMLEAVGGRIIFYHYRNGKPVRLEKPDLPSYSSEQRNTAFIAGTPQMAEWLWEQLVKYWREV